MPFLILIDRFEKVHPVPSWANYSKPVTTSSSLPTTVSKSQTLKPGPISLRRLRNVGENSKEGKSKVLLLDLVNKKKSLN